MKRIALPALSLVLIGSLFAGCAGKPQKASDDDQYEYVYQTGSNLPVRVPKKKKTDDASTASNVQQASGEVLRGVTGEKPFHNPTGGN